jgi:hypothetical protein
MFSVSQPHYLTRLLLSKWIFTLNDLHDYWDEFLDPYRLIESKLSLIATDLI